MHALKVHRKKLGWLVFVGIIAYLVVAAKYGGAATPPAVCSASSPHPGYAHSECRAKKPVGFVLSLQVSDSQYTLKWSLSCDSSKPVRDKRLLNTGTSLTIRILVGKPGFMADKAERSAAATMIGAQTCTMTADATPLGTLAHVHMGLKALFTKK